MRLLELKPDGKLVLTEYNTKDVPSYAILSHTWAQDSSGEVSFQDVQEGISRSKPGWRKVDFCADRAAADGLRFFWIDTCCIDKTNAVELSANINSMFRFYQKAARCYVYLSDVSICEDGWEAAFRKSRWFTRGWTLQELIAPTLVDFYESKGDRLGNKLSLEAMIHDITGIERNALRGDPLSNFTINERMSWAERRKTTIEEDEIYSLLGIFDGLSSYLHIKRASHKISLHAVNLWRGNR